MRLILPCISGLELGGRFEKAGGFIQSPAGSFAVCLGLHAQELLKSDYLQSTRQGVMSEIRIQETQLFRVRTSTKIWGNHGKSGLTRLQLSVHICLDVFFFLWKPAGYIANLPPNRWAKRV